MSSDSFILLYFRSSEESFRIFQGSSLMCHGSTTPHDDYFQVNLLFYFMKLSKDDWRSKVLEFNISTIVMEESKVVL